MRTHQPRSPRDDENCPCGSGKTFGNCCIDKAFRWTRNADGHYAKSVPMSDELADVLRRQRARFVELFGREPGDDDPVFLDAYHLTTPEDCDAALEQVLDQIGVDPAYIHAYRKTGRLVTEGNVHLLSEAELAEWNEAFDDYGQLPEQIDHEQERSALDSVLPEVLRECRNCVTVLAVALERGCEFASARPADTARTCALFSCAKSIKSLRALDTLTANSFGEDAIVIARTIYENYLYVTYVLTRPAGLEAVIDAKAGLAGGTHEYRRTRSGRTDRRIIVERSTGREFCAEIPKRSMAAASRIPEDLEVFDYLYGFLSQYVHPDIRTIGHYFNGSTFDHRMTSMLFEAQSLGLVHGVLMLDALAQPDLLDKKTLCDVRHYLGRVKSVLSEFLEALTAEAPENGLFEVLRRRIGYIQILKENRGVTPS